MKMFLSNKFMILLFSISGILFISAGSFNSSDAPEGYTGASGITCQGCHGGNTLNASGGSMVISGLPDEYTPGTVYTFSVTITHNSPNRNRWGFSIKAIGSNNIDAGTFSTTNTNAGKIGNELGHINAPFQSGSSYTFSNLRWTAPASPTASQQTINFFAAGNAGNGAGSSGDFIYTATKTMIQRTSSVSDQLPELDKWTVTGIAGKAVVRMNITKSSKLQVSLLTADGKEVARLPAQQLGSGVQTLTIPTAGMATGTYILTLTNGTKRESKQFVIQ